MKLTAQLILSAILIIILYPIGKIMMESNSNVIYWTGDIMLWIVAAIIADAIINSTIKLFKFLN